MIPGGQPQLQVHAKLPLDATVIAGFPDPARDAELLSRARRTATGGWVVQLTDAPLDLDNPAHLNALKRAYVRFPEIGGRSAP